MIGVLDREVAEVEHAGVGPDGTTVRLFVALSSGRDLEFERG